MARMSLPPGFRFHPTDVELVMYYLKRKVMGKKLHFEAIAEVNIYRFSPWDLPDKSCLKSKDLEWFFFCPIEKKYASGVRVKRSTENGHWKTTGKDRPVFYKKNIVGMVRTLVFHLGHAPQGQRTDWVIYEFRILDKQLAEARVQDTYVLCKVFKKSGPGPKNGAQYGAPFNEADWDDDDDDDTRICSASLPTDGPPFITSALPENQSSYVVTNSIDPGSTSGLSLSEAGPSSAGPATSDMFLDRPDDEIVRLLAPFTADIMLQFNENRNHETQDHHNNDKNSISLPCPTGNDIYNDLDGLDNSFHATEGGFHFTGMQKDDYLLNHMFPHPQDDLAYLELNDLMAPLNYCPMVNGTEQTSNGNFFAPCNPDHMSSRENFSCMNHYASDPSQYGVLPDGYREEGLSDALQMVNNNGINQDRANHPGHGFDFP